MCEILLSYFNFVTVTEVHHMQERKKKLFSNLCRRQRGVGNVDVCRSLAVPLSHL